MTVHQITCAADDCPEFSLTAQFKATTRDEAATAHRASVQADGWTDHEARDYCPDHSPNATR